MTASCDRSHNWPALLVISLTLLVQGVGLTAENSLKSAEDLRLVPFPKVVTLEPGRFSFSTNLLFEVSDTNQDWVGMLNRELERAGIVSVQFRPLKSDVPSFRVSSRQSRLFAAAQPQQTNIGSYTLEVHTNEIVCAARETAGLFYGLQTLCQLIRANGYGGSVPCLSILDWPSLPWRCFQDDLTRGPSSTLDTLKFEASLASYLKLNLMTYYMEYQFTFKRHPKIGPREGSLTAEELAALVEYTKPLHIDILGNQQSFGHFGQILKHADYALLRETSDVLTPVREETYQFLDDLYSEVCPVLPFPWFNVCCDETEGLGTGPSRELASRVGVGGIYVAHIRRLHDLLRDKYQKRMMMWGDIILQHPERLSEVPKDTIMLSWGYDPRASFESQILPFARSGYEFFVCPGVSDWNRILPDFGVAVTNIQNFIRDGARHGALGVINTDWQDDGEALKAVKWHADAWAAECAWNASATSIEAFNRRIGAVLFGEAADEFGQAVELLSRTHRLPGLKGMFNARFWERDFIPTARRDEGSKAASNLLAIVKPAIAHLESCRRQAKCNQQVLDVLLFGARRMELIGQRMLDAIQAVQLYEVVRSGSAPQTQLAKVEELLRQNRDAHESLGRQFARLWLSESKPYALDWTLTRYTNIVADYEVLLAKLAAVRNTAERGGRLPTAEDLGLAAPKPAYRRIVPSLSPAGPLPASVPWIEPSATHRLGLLIRAGENDRFDLPIEVELSLPGELTGKPARAFLIKSNEAPREVAAQLDALESSSKTRLVAVLPGLLPHGGEAAIHVYLGLHGPPAPLANKVYTNPGHNGMQWLENDRVRLLLGPEGAHIYRWELKQATGRDLTMPGESDWAGFSDIHAYRGSEYRLAPGASGPAMVEYECNAPSGHTKTLRLYAGASWIEVFLNEPTPVYWDYDDPKNFAADGPTPGQWLFSDGQSGAVGREADGVAAQVKAPNTFWGIKQNPDGVCLGLITPGAAVLHVIAPGAGAGGVGIESSAPAYHFVTFGGRLTAPAPEIMNHLQSTLDLKHPIAVQLQPLQAR